MTCIAVSTDSPMKSVFSFVSSALFLSQNTFTALMLPRCSSNIVPILAGQAKIMPLIILHYPTSVM